jgi:predicted CXXCH cytochrome family protein
MDARPNNPRPSWLCHTLVLAPFLVFSTPAFGQVAALAGTPHDFRFPTSPGLAPGNACTTCHLTVVATLDPPTRSDGSVPPAPTRQPAGPGPTSLICLSCHDGTMRDVGVRSTLSLGTDLSDDHPVGRWYDLQPSRGLRPVSIPLDAGLRLIAEDSGYLVECVTCHDPHDNRRGNFLRMTNEGSVLCLTCHAK